MMMLAMLSLVPIETHLEADFVVCLPSDLCGIPTHVKVFRKLTRFDQKSGLVVILQFTIWRFESCHQDSRRRREVPRKLLFTATKKKLVVSMI